MIQATQPPKLIVMDEPEVALPAQEAFQLLDAGTGPRAVLRYGRATAPWTVTRTSALTTRRLDQGAWTAPAAIPALVTSVIVTPDAARPHRYHLRFMPATSGAPSPDADQRLDPWRRGLAGRLVTLDLDARGQLARPSFDDDLARARSRDALDLLHDTLLGSVIPLPDPPVGAHARWRVVTAMRIGGCYGKQTATYTLTERGATRWKLHVQLQQAAAEQRITAPGVPAGVDAELIALFRRSEADVELDPRQPVGGPGSAALEDRLHVRLGKPGAPPVDQMFEDLGQATTTVAP